MTHTITEQHPQRRRHPADVRDARRDQGRSPSSAASSSAPATAGSTARTTAPRSRASTAPGRRTPPAPSRSCSTPASRRCCSAPTPAPNPAEALLHALAACLTTSLVYVAAARKVRLTEVESTLEGDMDVRGASGSRTRSATASSAIRVTFRVEGDAPPEKLREVVERAQARSAVFDMVSQRRAGRRRASIAALSVPWPSSSTATATGGGRAARRARRAPGRRLRRPARPRTTATAATRSRTSRRCGEPATSPRRSRARSAASAWSRSTTSSSPRAPGARRRVGGDRREHAPGRRGEHGRRWRIAVAAGNERRAAAFGARWRAIVADGVVLAAAISEPQPGPHPARTIATRTASRLAVDGRKIFCTDVAGRDRALHRGDLRRRGRRRALRLRADPGRRARRDRARRLGRARHARLRQPLGDLRRRRAAAPARCAAGSRSATPTGYMERNLSAGLFHASASLGIAEAAHAGVDSLTSRRAAARDAPRTQTLVGRERDRALRRRGRARPRRALIDEHHQATGRRRGSPRSSPRSSPRRRRRRRSSTRPPCGSSTARSRSRAARLHERPPARARLPRRARRRLHAPARRGRAHEFLGRVALGLGSSLQ